MDPVRSLQHMLNQLARTIQALPRLAETGVFGEATLEAVMIFQRDFGLSVTGIVDQATWDRLVAIYGENLFQFGAPPALHVFPSGTTALPEGHQAPELLIVQAMMNELYLVISNFEKAELNGINGGATFRNLKRVQRLSAMPESGILNRATWAVLAALYRTLVTRHATHSVSPLVN